MLQNLTPLYIKTPKSEKWLKWATHIHTWAYINSIQAEHLIGRLDDFLRFTQMDRIMDRIPQLTPARFSTFKGALEVWNLAKIFWSGSILCRHTRNYTSSAKKYISLARKYTSLHWPETIPHWPDFIPRFSFRCRIWSIFSDQKLYLKKRGTVFGQHFLARKYTSAAINYSSLARFYTLRYTIWPIFSEKLYLKKIEQQGGKRVLKTIT